MLKFNRVVCLLLVCTCAGLVYAKATKILSFNAVNAGVTENADADGVAMLNVDANSETQVQISMTDFLPDMGYYVTVIPGIARAAVSTNAAGNFQYHSVIHFDVLNSGVNPCVIVWRDDDNDGARHQNPDDLFGTEDRSVGCLN